MSEMSIILASRSCGFGSSAVRVDGRGVRDAVARVGCVRAALFGVRPVPARAADAPVGCVRASAFVAVRSVAMPAHGAAARVACARALAAAVASETDQP